MTSFEKLYLESRCDRDGDGCLMVPSKAKIVQIIDDGVHINTLDHAVTYEGSRSHLRKIADKERATFEQKLKLDAKKAARTDKKTSKKADKKRGKKDSDAANLGNLD